MFWVQGNIVLIYATLLFQYSLLPLGLVNKVEIIVNELVPNNVFYLNLFLTIDILDQNTINYLCKITVLLVFYPNSTSIT